MTEKTWHFNNQQITVLKLLKCNLVSFYNLKFTKTQSQYIDYFHLASLILPRLAIWLSSGPGSATWEWHRNIPVAESGTYLPKAKWGTLARFLKFSQVPGTHEWNTTVFLDPNAQ